MRTDKKIYQLKIKLKELKNGGHVSPESLQRFVPLNELKKLIKCWYDEKPLDQIGKPTAILKYEELIASANFLRREMNHIKYDDVFRLIYDSWEIILNTAFQHLYEENKKDPNLFLWLDYDVPQNVETSSIVPLSIGVRSLIVPKYGYGFCPSTAALSTKISALEEALKNVCDGYESKALEPFLIDPVS